jgi:hypothetical protein
LSSISLGNTTTVRKVRLLQQFESEKAAIAERKAAAAAAAAAASDEDTYRSVLSREAPIATTRYATSPTHSLNRSRHISAEDAVKSVEAAYKLRQFPSLAFSSGPPAELFRRMSALPNLSLLRALHDIELAAFARRRQEAKAVKKSGMVILSERLTKAAEATTARLEEACERANQRAQVAVERYTATKARIDVDKVSECV